MRQLHALFGSGYQPLQHRVEIRLFLCTDTIAADFSMRDGL